MKPCYKIWWLIQKSGFTRKAQVRRHLREGRRRLLDKCNERKKIYNVFLKWPLPLACQLSSSCLYHLSHHLSKTPGNSRGPHTLCILCIFPSKGHPHNKCLCLISMKQVSPCARSSTPLNPFYPITTSCVAKSPHFTVKTLRLTRTQVSH